MIAPASRELRDVQRLAIELDKAISAYAAACQSEAARTYATTGRPFAPEAESYPQQIRSILQQRRRLARAFQ